MATVTTFSTLSPAQPHEWVAARERDLAPIYEELGRVLVMCGPEGQPHKTFSTDLGSFRSVYAPKGLRVYSVTVPLTTYTRLQAEALTALVLRKWGARS